RHTRSDRDWSSDVCSSDLPEHAEQSSEDVWRAVAHATRTALKAAGAKPEDVRGVSFDATCSLVVLDAEDRPVSVSTTAEDRWDEIGRASCRERARVSVVGG